MPEQRGSYFDHVAIAAHRWEDAYDCFVRGFGGRWVVGGDGGDFQPAQLKFAGGAKVEIIQPGQNPDGFIHRFLDQRGPSPHHVTFRVTDLDAFGETCAAFGFDTFPGMQLPDQGHRELFVHPKVTGLGTLVQAIETDVDYEGRVPPPPGFPAPGDDPHVLEWMAWAVPDPKLTAKFLTTATGASIDADADAWSVLTWDGDKRIVLVPATGEAGVDHLLIRRAHESAPNVGDALAQRERAETVLGTRLLLAGRLA